MYSPSFKLVFNYVWNGIPAWYKCLEKMRCKFRFAFYSRFLFILIKVTYYIRFTLFFLLLYLSICKLCNIRCRHYRYHCTGFLMKMHARAHRVMSVCTQLHIPSYTRSEAECLRKDQLLCNLVRNIYFYFFNERCWPTTTSKVQNKGHVSWTWSTWPY